ncbi:MAG: hypothetical protein H8D23_08430 [Candidatus Brocadiales bacterium]|nr:hypothetical protein [Candidatus Brocadiales bacterium]
MNLVKNDKLYQLDIEVRGNNKFGFKIVERIFAVYNPFNKIGPFKNANITEGSFEECSVLYEAKVTELLKDGFEEWSPTDWTCSYNYGIAISGYSGKWIQVE